MDATKYRRPFLLVVYCAGACSLGAAIAIFGPVLTVLAVQTNSPVSAMGIIYATHSFGYVVGAWATGRMHVDQEGHRANAVALISMAGIICGVPALPTLWGMALALLGLGAAAAVVDVVTNTLLLASPSDRPGRSVSALHFCFGAGSLLAPVALAGSIESAWPIDITFRLFGAAFALVGIAFAWLPEWHAAKTVVTDRTHENLRATALIAVTYALYAGLEVGFGGWISTYAVLTGLADAAGGAYLTAVFWGAFTASRLMAILCGARMSATTLLGFVFAGTALCGAALLVWSDVPAVLWTTTAGFGFFLGPIFPMLLVFSRTRVAVSGQATSWYLVGAGVGGMIIPWAMGALIDAVGPASFAWLAEIAVVATGIAFWRSAACVAVLRHAA